MSNSTWTRQRLFDLKTIQKSKTITFRERVQLLFRRSQFVVEENTLIRYKTMNGVAYILEVRHSLTNTDKEES